MLTAVVLYVLIFAGFVGVGWITNAVFGIIRKKDEEGRFDRVGALVLWASLFSTYTYFVANLLR